MTRLYDDPGAFSEDLLAGFLDLYGDRVLGVEGGVIRASETPGKVAVVVGGGSGHYPAFCGVVGPGFADGAVVGNVFTSPSTQEAYSVGRAAAHGAGLLFCHRQLRGRRHELHARSAAPAARRHRHPGRLRHRRHR